MDTQTAQQMVGQVVNSDCDIWGILEYVTADGWAGIRGPKMPGTDKGRLDEIQVGRIFPDPT